MCNEEMINNNNELKKILILTPRFPYPVIGGDKLRIYNICRLLATKYHLTLLTFCENEEELSFPIPDDGVFKNVERILLPKLHSYMSTICSLPTRTPLQVAYYRCKKFKATYNELVSSHDAVLSHLIRCGDYARKTKNIPKFLEMTDAISLNYHRVRQLKKTIGFKSFVFRVEAKRLLQYERDIINDFDLNILVSNTDKDFLFGNSHNDKVLVCSNGVDLSNLPYAPPKIENKVLVFIGNMRTVQNLDACIYFCEQILPTLRKHDEYRFRIVGAMSDELISQFTKYEGVEVTGRVDSISDAVKDASIGVCPMRIGAGVQNKVLEYMSLGLPTVTTTLGYEGIHAIPGSELLIADTPEQFVEQIEHLKSNKNFSINLSKNARLFVEKNHDWAAMLKPLLDKIQTFV